MAGGACGKWWMARTNLEKTLISFSVILLLTILITILVGVIQHSKSSDGTNGNGICSSLFCMEKAGSMMSMADFSVDPCEDFYQYSCGGYARKHGVAADFPEASVEHDAVNAVRLHLRNWLQSDEGSNISAYRNAKTLFNSCLIYDQASDSPLSILEKAMEQQKLGHWAILDEHSWRASDRGLEKNLASLALLGIPVVFQLEVVRDLENPGKFITQLSPGKPLLEMHQFDSLKNDLFFHFVETTLLLLGVDKKLVSSKVEEIFSTEEKMIDLRKKANEKCGDNSSSADLLTMRVDSLEDMDDQMYTDVRWSEILAEILSTLNSSGVKNYQFELYCKRHIREFNDYFHYSYPKSHNIYFGWRFFSSIMEFLGPSFRQLQAFYRHHASGTMKGPTVPHDPKWKFCVNLVERLMLPVLAHAYKEQALSDSLLKEKIKIAEAIRSSWERLMSSAKWLSATEKETIKQKVKDSKFEVAISKAFSNLEKLEEMFSELSLENDHVVYNVLRFRRFKVLKELEKLISSTTPSPQWDYQSLTSTDDLHRFGNRIVVYYDKLRSPYLSLHQQSYLNYGAFGSYLGRQLNRYLATLSLNSKRANETLWNLFLRSNKDRTCEADGIAFSSHDEPITTLEEWSELLGELTAVKAAYESYKSQENGDDGLPGFNLSHEQLFFLSYAQTRCEVPQNRHGKGGSKISSRSSVNFALQNHGRFSEAFSCKENSAMNPSKKCQTWN